MSKITKENIVSTRKNVCRNLKGLEFVGLCKVGTYKIIKESSFQTAYNQTGYVFLNKCLFFKEKLVYMNKVSFMLYDKTVIKNQSL